MDSSKTEWRFWHHAGPLRTTDMMNVRMHCATAGQNHSFVIYNCPTTNRQRRPDYTYTYLECTEHKQHPPHSYPNSPQPFPSPPLPSTKPLAPTTQPQTALSECRPPSWTPTSTTSARASLRTGRVRSSSSSVARSTKSTTLCPRRRRPTCAAAVTC